MNDDIQFGIWIGLSLATIAAIAICGIWWFHCTEGSDHKLTTEEIHLMIDMNERR